MIRHDVVNTIHTYEDPFSSGVLVAGDQAGGSNELSEPHFHVELVHSDVVDMFAVVVCVDFPSYDDVFGHPRAASKVVIDYPEFHLLVTSVNRGG